MDDLAIKETANNTQFGGYTSPHLPVFECLLHKGKPARFKCKTSKCFRLTCQECIDSPMKGYCVECVEKDIKRNVKGFIICSIIGVLYIILSLVIIISQNLFTPLQTGGKIYMTVFLLLSFVSFVFWYQGARTWARIGHAERGFAQPEGLKYPLYGAWLFWHGLGRFFYFSLFVSMPFVLAPFVGIPVMIRVIKQSAHIKKHRNTNHSH